MAKLGLIINNTYQGLTRVYSANDLTGWSKSVVDIRTILEKLIIDDNSQVPLFLSYSDEGVFLILLRPIYGRTGDNVTAWIHIPSDIVISGKELVEVVEFVKMSISGGKINAEELDRRFAKEYESASATHPVETVKNDKIAVRKYASLTKYGIRLDELLDTKHLYQPQYAQYRYILLLDKNSITCPTAYELPDSKLVESILVKPVEPVDKFSAYLNGKEFTKPIYAYKGDKLVFVWKRRDYKDIEKEVQVTDDIKVPSITHNEYMKLLKYQSIHVYDSNTRETLDEYYVYISDKLIQSNVYINECAYDRTKIKVTAPGYNDETDIYNLNHQVHIALTPKTFIYTFRFTTKDGSALKAKVESKGLLKRTPFEGYHSLHGHEPYENSVNDLVYDPFDKPYRRKTWIIRLICFIVGLVLGVFGAAYVANKTIENLESKLKSANKGHTTYTTPTQQETPKKENDPYADIIKYMDTSIRWNKSELDKYPQIHGLWDALNEYKFEEIKRFREPLKKSTKFTELISAIEKDSKTRADYRDSYNTNKDDLEITIDNYIKRIQSEKPAKPAPPKKATEKKEDSQSKSKEWFKR